MDKTQIQDLQRRYQITYVYNKGLKCNTNILIMMTDDYILFENGENKKIICQIIYSINKYDKLNIKKISLFKCDLNMKHQLDGILKLIKQSIQLKISQESLKFVDEHSILKLYLMKKPIIKQIYETKLKMDNSPKYVARKMTNFQFNEQKGYKNWFKFSLSQNSISISVLGDQKSFSRIIYHRVDGFIQFYQYLTNYGCWESKIKLFAITKLLISSQLIVMQETKVKLLNKNKQLIIELVKQVEIEKVKNNPSEITLQDIQIQQQYFIEQGRLDTQYNNISFIISQSEIYIQDYREPETIGKIIYAIQSQTNYIQFKKAQIVNYMGFSRLEQLMVWILQSVQMKQQHYRILFLNSEQLVQLCIEREHQEIIHKQIQKEYLKEQTQEQKERKVKRKIKQQKKREVRQKKLQKLIQQKMQRYEQEIQDRRLQKERQQIQKQQRRRLRLLQTQQKKRKRQIERLLKIEQIHKKDLNKSQNLQLQQILENIERHERQIQQLLIGQKLNKIEQKEYCCVCHETFEINTIYQTILLECKHLFHIRCMKMDIEHRNMCAICRKPISNNQILFIRKTNAIKN